ncbi:hypothetical protein [Neisseria cinerea]|uniref:Uncharacterized protein n=1 Tax=Neisseria cinerea TaxID=483 RepID=A0A7T3BP11_NEICI|nr:hypothetical protein [Neisseria cinerea]QPT38364.1 hypothetical protein I6G28_02080 [Neisseria cinerea]
MPSENGQQVIRGKSASLPSRLLNYTSRHLPAENGFHIQHPFDYKTLQNNILF